MLPTIHTPSALVGVTPSDTADDPAGPAFGFVCLATGTIKCNDLKGNAYTITIGAADVNVPKYFPVTRVFSTGTSITSPTTNILLLVG